LLAHGPWLSTVSNPGFAQPDDDLRHRRRPRFEAMLRAVALFLVVAMATIVVDAIL
jgi:hypothetical protein